MKALLTALAPAALIVGTLGAAIAKLPPVALPDPVKAEEKKARDVASAATASAQQAKAEDRAAARYINEQKSKGKAVLPQMASNWGEMEAKAREAASKVQGAQPVPLAQPMAAAKVTAAKK